MNGGVVEPSQASGRGIAARSDDPEPRLGVEEARVRILAAFAPLAPVEIPLEQARGLVLASEIVASSDLPPFTNAAMDGYAISAIDTVNACPAAPVVLPVIGQAAAGHVSDMELLPGTAVRVMTGAPVPPGADAVVRFEETAQLDTDGRPEQIQVAIGRQIAAGANIRPMGEELPAGASALPAGALIRPAEIGLLAALGQRRVIVHRRPRVVILATGDEICPMASEPKMGQIRDSNSPMIAAYVEACGAVAIPLGIARDARDDLRAKLAAVGDADLLLTIGGVSVGDYDLVKDVLREAGRVDLWQVRIKPGKPLAFGWIGERPLIGLPGNPVAAAVAFLQFVRPAILTMLGRRDLDLPTVQGRLMERVENRGGRRHYVRVRMEPGAAGWDARPVGPAGAGSLSSLARANGLLVIPERTETAEAGQIYPVQMLDWGLG